MQRKLLDDLKARAFLVLYGHEGYILQISGGKRDAYFNIRTARIVLADTLSEVRIKTATLHGQSYCNIALSVLRLFVRRGRGNGTRRDDYFSAYLVAWR